MPVKTYTIWQNAKLTVPFGYTRKGVSLTKDIAWGSGTVVNSAELFLSVKPGMDGSGIYIEMTEQEVVRLEWGIGDLTEKTDRVDVLGYLLNGKNVFKFVGYKAFLGFLARTFTFTVTLILDYTGPDPDWRDVFPWEKIFTYTAVTIGVLASIVTIMNYAERERRR